MLFTAVEELCPEANNDFHLKNIRRWLDQSEYDASIPDGMIQSFERQLRSKLDIQSQKLGLADLYSRLLTEWMNPSASLGTPTEDTVMQDDGYEVVDQQKERLRKLCDDFESVVFEPFHTNEKEIDMYLSKLFCDDKGAEALDKLQKGIRCGTRQLLENKASFNEHTLTWCIQGLLAEDLLSDEKQKMLQDFLKNKAVLGEIADVLNMRFTDIENWEWDAGEKGIPVLPRQQLNGKYRIWMDEDVLQAIFLHFIGTKLCVGLREDLLDLVYNRRDPFWKWDVDDKMQSEDWDRRRYYVDSRPEPVCSVIERRKDDYLDYFFVTQLPENVQSSADGDYYNDDGDDKPSDTKKPHKNVKQRLLRTLASEVTPSTSAQ